MPAAVADPPEPPAVALVERVRHLAADIKLSHTVFALPWALLATFLAATGQPGGLPHFGQIGLILLCMVLARTFAMAMNRALDARLDALNPRTARRAIPAGRLSRSFVVTVAAACAIGFLAACAGFWPGYGNRWPLLLGPLVLVVLGAYPLIKRFSELCHYYLGFCLALAPVCAWVAIRGEIATPPVLMFAAVCFWTAGFDIIYACQDFESDRATGTFSVPARVGVGAALWIARVTHLLCLAALLALGGVTPQFGWIYATAVTIAAALLLIEHSLVRRDDLSKVNLAFFTINGVISLVIGTLGIVDVFA
jgi:4-hydroxybenzoate polyprenyltransferase